MAMGCFDTKPCTCGFLQFLLFLSLLYTHSVNIVDASRSQGGSNRGILVVGSLNADTFLPVDRLPTEGENLTTIPGRAVEIDVPGGKGCNQAVACARLGRSTNAEGATPVSFLGQFGNDAAAQSLRAALVEAGVDVGECGVCESFPSGRGYVFLEKSGKVSAVVVGGSNVEGWEEWEDRAIHDDSYLSSLLENKSCVLLQREIPEEVNYLVAKKASELGVTVIQDLGGEDRPMDAATLSLCDYLIPNASELKRLLRSLGEDAPIGEDDAKFSAVQCARALQRYGAKNVLVTLGDEGSVLVLADGSVTVSSACELPADLSVVDETGAGDCYRAAFAVALAEGGRSLQSSMDFASAAGALTVTKKGAVPSIPKRDSVGALCLKSSELKATSFPRGGASTDDECPCTFGSRLNSMKDRPELWDGPLKDVRDWVRRQGSIRGLGCVDFNYPQHFHTWTNAEAKEALIEAGLKAGAVCLRYPSKFARGAMNHPNANLRREAIDLTKEAAETARYLGCNEVVVWSAYDGYDYPFQVDYHEKWRQIVEAFQECCDAYPEIKWSLEFKPTDENTRFFTVPSTGAALLLVKEINRPNMGLTLDMGHMLMAGENPGQSIAMVGEKLFGIQLNDGYTRLAAEDGMIFGSIHPSLALEAIYQLQHIEGGFRGHLYFDTFPQRTDPVKEAEFNIMRVKRFWSAAKNMDTKELRRIMDEHDAVGALDMINEVLRTYT